MVLKQVVYIVIFIIVIAATIFLYSHQLGAIPFLLISFYLFYVAFKRLTKIRQEKKRVNE
ncbi:hypothetical protein B1NLA3E_21635 [Bacillus sp. 1NLA3E]|nr:hypothetical protein B1NLA3E_21635 [Bacillus sp. 1NLA3E]